MPFTELSSYCFFLHLAIHLNVILVQHNFILQLILLPPLRVNQFVVTVIYIVIVVIDVVIEKAFIVIELITLVVLWIAFNWDFMSYS